MIARTIDGDGRVADPGAPRPRLILTWDDGPVGDLPLRILDQRGDADVGIELYWCGANLLHSHVRAMLGIAEVQDVPRTKDGHPVSWLRWLDDRRGDAERATFLATAIDPPVRDMCRTLRAQSGVGPLDDLIGYHGITHDPPEHASHPVSLTRQALVEELIFFELLIQVAFGAPDYHLVKGRPPYGAGLRFRFQTKGRMYESAYPRLVAAGERFRSGFVWAAWDADTKDHAFVSCEENGVVGEARTAARQWQLPKVRILLHERHAAESRTLPRLLAQAAAQRYDGSPIEGRGPSGMYRIEPGPCWSIERLATTLASQRTEARAGRRVGHLAREFLRDHTPFEFEPSWRDPTRVRLESFDDVSFVATVVAMAAARDLDALVRHVQMLAGSLDNDGPPVARDRLAMTVTRMQVCGLVRDATNEIACAASAGSLLRRLRLYKAGSGEATSDSRIYLPIKHARHVEPWLEDGDVLLMVLRWPAIDRPSAIGHCGIVSRTDPDGSSCFLHASDIPLGKPHGRRAGVSLATRWMPDRRALRDDDEWCTVGEFLEENADRWLGIVVLRPQCPWC